tara:strand:+ start:1272 stop:1694 length:423 start_codon:yes stop_codon:yes gene_type:complete
LIKKISDKDKKDWESFVKSNEKIYDKDSSNETNPRRNISTKTIDLHGYSLENANKTINEYIRNSYSENIKRLIVITGKGLRSNTQTDPYVSKDLSILKNSVPEFIKNNIELMKLIKEIKIADKEEGGKGALIIYLKNSKE